MKTQHTILAFLAALCAFLATYFGGLLDQPEPAIVLEPISTAGVTSDSDAGHSDAGDSDTDAPNTDAR